MPPFACLISVHRRAATFQASEEGAESSIRTQREARELAASESEKWQARYNEQKKAPHLVTLQYM